MNAVTLPPVYAGDAWTQTLTINYPTYNFQGTTATMRIMLASVGPVTDVGVSVNQLGGSWIGSSQFVLYLTPSQTMTLGPGSYVGTVIAQGGNNWGPTTVFIFNFIIMAPVVPVV